MTPKKQPLTSGKDAEATENGNQLELVAALVLERERKRKLKKKKKARRKAKQREEEQRAAVRRMQQSVELIKWSIVTIASVMFLGLVIGIWTLMAVHKEVEKVQEFVSDIESQVDDVKDALQNPMQALGGAFGKSIDDKLKSLVGGEKE